MTATIRFREVIGRRVFDADGCDLGRVRDMIAEPHEGRLRVTQLLVGPANLLHRLGIGTLHDHMVAWSSIERIDRDIHLRVVGTE